MYPVRSVSIKKGDAPIGANLAHSSLKNIKISSSRPLETPCEFASIWGFLGAGTQGIAETRFYWVPGIKLLYLSGMPREEKLNPGMTHFFIFFNILSLKLTPMGDAPHFFLKHTPRHKDEERLKGYPYGSHQCF